MSGLCGWVGGALSAQAGAEAIQGMGASLCAFDGTSLAVRQGTGYALAAAASPNRVFAGAAFSYSAVIWGTPQFTDKDLAETAHRSGPALALIEAMRRFGADCCARLTGAFAFAIAHDRDAEALLAIDRMGIHGLVYRQEGDTLIFGSSAAAIHRYPGVTTSVDWQSIYNYVHFHMVPAPATAILKEQRLLPGQYLHWRAGTTNVGRYWHPRFVENEERPFAELRDEFIGTLTDAVRRTSAGTRTGAFLSGGTDSSTVSGLLGRVNGKPADTFSIGFEEQGYDEIEYARIASRHFNTTQHEYYVTPADIVDAIPRIAAIHDQPFGNSSAVPTYCCARFARNAGMELLLGGDGGDELFGGNERYATHHIYSQYEHIPALFRRGLFEPLARALPGGQLIPPIRWYQRLIEIVATPLPDRLDAHNLLIRLGSDSVFTPELLARVDSDGPRELMRTVYEDTDASALINRMLAYDFRFTLADSDLPKVMKSCELAGLPVAFPMLDDRLMEFSARLAPHLKLKGTKLRYFFKEALRGFLPDEIIVKRKHGFGLPFGPWLRKYPPLRDLVMDDLSKLRSRGFIRADFVDQLMTSHLEQHAGYYGTMAWVLVMLEEWMSKLSHRPEQVTLDRSIARAAATPASQRA